MEKPDYYDSTVKEFGEGFVIIKKKIIFDKDKTTPKGEHSKLNSSKLCKYPERDCCNYGDFFVRCPFMKYKREYSIWFCDYKSTKEGKEHERNNINNKHS